MSAYFYFWFDAFNTLQKQNLFELDYLMYISSHK